MYSRFGYAQARVVYVENVLNIISHKRTTIAKILPKNKIQIVHFTSVIPIAVTSFEFPSQIGFLGHHLRTSRLINPISP